MRSRAGSVSPGPAAARYERRDRDVQAIEEIRFKEPRHGLAAAFDEHRPPTALVQPLEQDVEPQPAGFGGHVQDLCVTGSGRVAAFGMHDERRRGTVGKNAVPRTELGRRIEHHANGVRPFDVPHGELRVVARDGAGADENRGRQRPQPMQVPHVVRARHVVGVARGGRNATVETLAQMGQREGPPGSCPAERRIQIEQRLHRRRRCGPCAVARATPNEPGIFS